MTAQRTYISPLNVDMNYVSMTALLAWALNYFTIDKNCASGFVARTVIGVSLELEFKSNASNNI